jgi:hypothetical protein
MAMERLFFHNAGKGWKSRSFPHAWFDVPQASEPHIPVVAGVFWVFPVSPSPYDDGFILSFGIH